MRAGLVVNPVAGLGGRVGLKGSDGAAVQARARELGATPRAGERAALTLAELRSRLGDGFDLLTAAGPMGASPARAAGLNPIVVYNPGTTATTAADTAAADQAKAAGLDRLVAYEPGTTTTAADTVAAARELAAQVDVLLFAGGDGTARDVLDAVGSSVPVLGIPTGVKMHSAVFGVSPRAAAEVAALMAAGGVRIADAEVLDLDEEAVREGRVSARLYGYLRVPDVPVRIQQRKMGSSAPTPDSVTGIAAELAFRLDPAELLVLGPGGTTRAIAATLGVDVPVMGVNVLRGTRAEATDVTSRQLEDLVGSRPAWIVVTPIGGQGFLLGRGNQQISPAALRAAGRDRLLVVATEAKLAALGGRPLLVDTGDERLDQELAGYLPVLTGHGRTAMYPIR